MPLLAFNPPKRWNAGSKSSSLPFHWGHAEGTELLRVFKKGEGSMGSKGWLPGVESQYNITQLLQVAEHLRAKESKRVK